MAALVFRDQVRDQALQRSVGNVGGKLDQQDGDQQRPVILGEGDRQQEKAVEQRPHQDKWPAPAKARGGTVAQHPGGGLHQHGNHQSGRAHASQGGILDGLRRKNAHEVGHEDRAQGSIADIQAEPEQVDGEIVVPVQAFHEFSFILQ